MIWERVLLVALGGALGSVCRFGLGELMAHRLGSAMLGTFAANVSGALLFGLFIGLFQDRLASPSLSGAVFLIGFLGAYTTFSTLAFNTVDLADSGVVGRAFLNMGGTVVVGLAAAYAGLVLGRAVG